MTIPEPRTFFKSIQALGGSATTASTEKKSSDELAQIRTDLAASRNLMAADRTLMAWVRTSISLDSFGFTIYKVLQSFESKEGGLPHSESPRQIGLFLTALGTVAMVMGTLEYWTTLRTLHSHTHRLPIRRPAMIMAALMSVTGVFAFFSIVTRLF
jgi:putative membrane protein